MLGHAVGDVSHPLELLGIVAYGARATSLSSGWKEERYAIPGANVVFFVATPDDSGVWARSFIVPPVVPPGAYRVVAQCTTGPDVAPVVYAPQPIEVLAGDSASIYLPASTSGEVPRARLVEIQGQLPPTR